MHREESLQKELDSLQSEIVKEGFIERMKDLREAKAGKSRIAKVKIKR